MFNIIYIIFSLIIGIYSCIKAYTYMTTYTPILYKFSNIFVRLVWTFIVLIIGSLLSPLAFIYFIDKWNSLQEPYNPFKIASPAEDDLDYYIRH